MGPNAAGYGNGEEIDEAAYLKMVRERKALADSYDRSNDEAAHEDNLMLAGGENQWDQTAVRDRKRDGRPIYTVNKFPASIAQITGEVRRNRPAIQCKPGDAAATPEAADVFEGLIRAIERLSQANRVYARVVKSAAACGRGHMRIVPVYEDDEGFDTGLRIRAIRNVLSVKWDPGAQQDDKADAGWCIVTSELDKKGFEDAYPTVGSAAWANASAGQRQLAGWHSGRGDKVTVAEYWEVKREPYERYRMAHTQGGVSFANGFAERIDSTGEEMVVDGDPRTDMHATPSIDGMEAQQFLQQMRLEGWEVVQTRTAFKKKICMWLLGGEKIIAGPIEWMGNRIPIFTVVGEEIDVADETITHGVIRHAKDAQRGINYTRAAELEIISQSPKGAPMVPDDALEGYEDEWEDARRRPKAYRRYKWRPGMPAPQEAQPVSTNPGLQAFGQESSGDFEDTTGIHAASLGKKSNETSGVAIEARDSQTDTGTYVYIDNLNSTLESMGSELVAAIPFYYSAREQIMILGQDDAPAIVSLQNVKLDMGKYHVIAKAGPSYQTKREKAADMLMDMSKAAEPWARYPIFKRIIRFVDVPDADEFIAELDAIGQAMGVLPPAQGAAPAMPGAMPGAPQPGPPGGVRPTPPPGGPPSNVIPMPARAAAPPMRSADPLAGIPPSPPRAPAARTRVADGRMPAAAPGM